MKKQIKTVVLSALAAVFLFSLAGCYSKTAQELYSLPQASEEYWKLQEQINGILDADAEYASPKSGANRQAVQLQDLNGDGVDEAIAFFSVTGERPLKIYIFRRVDGDYEVYGFIEGDGTAIDSITYTDMDGDGSQEIIVGWQMSATLQMLDVYSIHGFQPTHLVNSDYSALTVADMNGDGNDDLVVLRISDSSLSGGAEVYSLQSDGEIVSSSASLSQGVEALSRVRSGRLSNGMPAVYVESVYGESNVITDILINNDGQLSNITADQVSGVSDETVRTYAVYCSDINNDGVLEVPFPILLQTQSETNYYVIDWYAYSSTGDRDKVLTTYHNYWDEWYLVLPDDWENNITLRREDAVSGERELIYSYIRDGTDEAEDFLIIYKLSGDNREERARLAGRFLLVTEGETIYAAEILADEGDIPLTIDSTLIKDNFHIIYSDWITGAT